MATKTSTEEKTEASGKPQVCDILIRNAYVLTLDPSRTVYPSGAIAITGNAIAAVGPEHEVIPRFKPRRVLDANGGTVRPGFIDGHYHTTIHLTRGAITDNPNVKSPANYYDWFNAIGDEEEYASALASCLEMVRHGYTAFMEPGTAFEPDAVAAAAENVGIRASVADPFLWDVKESAEVPGSGLKRAPCDSKRAMNLLGKELWRNKDPHSLVRAHVCVYGLGSASEELLKAAKACADENRVVLNQHHNFTVEEAEKNDTFFGGRHSLVHFRDIGLLDRNCTFSHMNVIREDEVQPIIDSEMSIVWIPGNYQFYGIASKVRTRTPDLIAKGTNVTFGLDAAKVWTFGEMELVGYLIARHWNGYVSPEKLLEMRTICAARALGLDDMIGSLEPGKRADVVIHRNNVPEAQPGVNVVQELMLVSRSRSVDTIIVNGDIIFKNGHSTRVDEEVVYQTARTTTKRMMDIMGFSPIVSWPIVQ